MITIINLRGATLPPGAVYIGRRMQWRPELAASPLANPFRVERDRAAAIAQYATWLDARLQAPDSPESQELARLVELARAGDLVLACWCFPSTCHGNIIKARIEARPAQPAALRGEARDD